MTDTVNVNEYSSYGFNGWLNRDNHGYAIPCHVRGNIVETAPSFVDFVEDDVWERLGNFRPWSLNREWTVVSNAEHEPARKWIYRERKIIGHITKCDYYSVYVATSSEDYINCQKTAEWFYCDAADWEEIYEKTIIHVSSLELGDLSD